MQVDLFKPKGTSGERVNWKEGRERTKVKPGGRNSGKEKEGIMGTGEKNRRNDARSQEKQNESQYKTKLGRKGRQDGWATSLQN